MIRKEIIGGQYGECLPSGVYAVLVPGSHIEAAVAASHTEMSEGRIALPDGGDSPLFLRITDVGGLQMAGQSHANGRVWHYAMNMGWSLRPEVSHGQSGHIFDHHGRLHIVQPGPDVTSQGYRYVDEVGRLVLGDETYYSPAFQLHEFTQHDGLAIGQGSTGGDQWPQGGAIAVYLDRRVLEPGDCRFIRFTRRGDQCAVTIVKLAERKTILLWFTIHELAVFPLEPQVPSPPATSPPPPVPTPTPIPPPPEPIPMPETPNRSDIVQQVAAQYGHLLDTNTHESCGQFTQRVLERLDGDWGHVGKTHGEQQYTPPGFEAREVGGHRVTGFSHDVIWHRPSNMQVDILGNASANSHPDPSIHGRAIPTWGLIDREHYRHNNPWIPTVPIGGAPPTPPPPTGDCAELEAENRALAANLDMMSTTLEQIRAELSDEKARHAGTFAQLQEWDARLKQALLDLEEARKNSGPRCDGRRVFGVRLPCWRA